jgi:predicted MFS family arabinose efflux permease
LVSLAIGASAGGLVGVLFGGPPVFLALAGLGLVLVWLNRWVWPCDRGSGVGGLDAAARDPLDAAVLVRRLIPMVLWSTGLYGVYTYLGAGLTAVRFSTGQTAAAILFYGCGAIVGVLVGGRVADRLGVRFSATASFAGLCACLLLRRTSSNTRKLCIRRPRKPVALQRRARRCLSSDWHNGRG